MPQIQSLFEQSGDILREQLTTRRQVQATAAVMIGFAGTVVAWGLPEIEESVSCMKMILMLFTHILLVFSILLGLWVIVPRNYYSGDSLRKGIAHAEASPQRTHEEVTAWALDSNVNAIEANRPAVRRLSIVVACGIGSLVVATVLALMLRFVQFL